MLLGVQNTELKFDLVSPVDELAKQIRMEFDFLHEAETMDAVGEHLMVLFPCWVSLSVQTQPANAL